MQLDIFDIIKQETESTPQGVPTVKEINKNFVIRYRRKDSKRTFLIGAGKYEKLVGAKFKNKHFKDAFESSEHKTTFKLRRGLEINFCSK